MIKRIVKLTSPPVNLDLPLRCFGQNRSIRVPNKRVYQTMERNIENMATRLLLLLAAITSWGGANAAREVCVEGFVMDKFCIDRGTLLDKPRVKTLENPEMHSVHCLVDISRCVNSGFNILQPNPSGSPSYANAFRLDDVGNQKVLEVARANGIDCYTCGNGGTIREGLRGTFFGTITQEATESKPATLAVKNMTVSPKTLDPNSMSDGCPRRANKPNTTLSTEAGSSATPTTAHGATALDRSVKMTICGIVTAVLLVQILNFL